MSELMIEIASPGDRAADLRALEADYIRLGVPEIVFIDQSKKSIRILSLTNGEYAECIVSTGTVQFRCIEGLQLDAAWILNEPRPDSYETVTRLLASE